MGNITRNDGTTSRQMLAAAPSALYIWCNGNLSYPKALARYLGREDLKIYGPSALLDDSGRFAGLRLSEVVVDHALTPTARQWEGWERLVSMVQPKTE